MTNSADKQWTIKIKAFLRCPPDRALISAEQEEERAKGLIKLALDDDSIPEKVGWAHRNAYALDRPPFVQACSIDFLHDPVLTHPLSGQRWDLENFELVKGWRTNKNTLVNGANQAVEKALGELKAGYQDPRKLFLALWRLLQEKIKIKEQEQGAPKVGPLWDLLPADPRTPHHTIWNHAAMASALAVTEGKPAFLLFNIASAQGFLATARRTQDLWMGSFLLSYLIWEGMRVLAERCGPDSIIAPQLRGQPLVDRWLKHKMELNLEEPTFEDLQVANFPNIFTAIVPADGGGELAKDMERAIHEKWQEIAKKVKEHIEQAINSDGKLAEKIKRMIEQGDFRREIRGLLKKSLEQRMRGLAPQQAGDSGDEQWEALWDRQLQEFLKPDIFWALVPWYPQESDLDRIVNQCQALLGESVKEFKKLWDWLTNNGYAKDHNIGMLYGPLAILAGRMLETRKNLRGFPQIKEEDDKCTLCGLRTVLHPSWISSDERHHYAELRAFWDMLAQVKGKDKEGNERKLIGRIRRGDRLCAVCLTKRLAWEAYFLVADPQEGGLKDINKEKLEFPVHILFPSTSSVATAAFKHEVIQALKRNEAYAMKLHQALEEYNEALKGLLRPRDGRYDIWLWSAAMPKTAAALKDFDAEERKEVAEEFLRFDGEWLYPDSFVREAIAREYRLDPGAIEEDQVRAARQALEGLLQVAEDCGIPRPSRYYALIAMDGDHMGEWLNGSRAPGLEEVIHSDCLNKISAEIPPEAKRPLGPATHMAIGTAGKNFALQIAKQIVEKDHLGKLIYAGGDDLLAFVPLEDLLSILQELRLRFSGDFVEQDGQYLLMMGSKATTSAGVVIAHHTHPLSHVVEEAHEVALKEDAKDGLGRDAFAVHLLRRSGERVVAGAKWRPKRPRNDDKEMVDVLEILKGLVDLLRRDGEGSLSDRFIYQLSEELALAGLPLEAQKPEIIRLLERHLQIRERKEREQTAKRLGEKLGNLLQALRLEELTRLMKAYLKVGGKGAAEEEQRERVLKAAIQIMDKLQTENVRPESGEEKQQLFKLLQDPEQLNKQDKEALKRFYDKFLQHLEFERFLNLLHLARFLASGGRGE